MSERKEIIELQKEIYNMFCELGLPKLFACLGLSRQEINQALASLIDVLIVKYDYCDGCKDRGGKGDNEWEKNTFILNPQNIYEALNGKICPLDEKEIHLAIRKLRQKLEKLKINTVLRKMKLPAQTKTDLARALFVELAQKIDLNQILENIEIWEEQGELQGKQKQPGSYKGIKDIEMISENIEEWEKEAELEKKQKQPKPNKSRKKAK